MNKDDTYVRNVAAINTAASSARHSLIWIATVNIMFNVGKPILRGKITAEFRAEEQGKAVSALGEWEGVKGGRR